MYVHCCNDNARGSREKDRESCNATVYLRYYPSAEFPMRFSQSAEGWKYSGRVSNYGRLREERGVGAMEMGGGGGGWRCVTAGSPVVRATQRLPR